MERHFFNHAENQAEDTFIKVKITSKNEKDKKDDYKSDSNSKNLSKLNISLIPSLNTNNDIEGEKCNVSDKKIAERQSISVLSTTFQELIESIPGNISNNSCLELDIDTSVISPFSPIYLYSETTYNPIPEAEYYDDILEKLLEEEEKNYFFKKFNYLDYQIELDPKRRASMINLIYNIANTFNLKQKTIFLAVQTMDRFLLKEKIDKKYFNLVSIGALIVSVKFNEIYYPAINSILKIFPQDNYTLKQVNQMERLILISLDYNLFPNHPMAFFDIISKKIDLTKNEYNLICFILELIQYENTLYPYKSSTLVLIAFLKVFQITKGNIYKMNNYKFNCEVIESTKKIFYLIKLNPNDNIVNSFEKCFLIIDELLKNIDSDLLKNIYDKYSKPEMLGTSINYFLK